MPKRKQGLAGDELAAVVSELTTTLESLRSLSEHVSGSYPESSAAVAFSAAEADVSAFLTELAGETAPRDNPVAVPKRQPFSFSEHRAVAVRLHQIADSIGTLFVKSANSYGVRSKVARLGQRANRSITPLSLHLEDIVASEHPHERDAYKVYSRDYVEKSP